MSIKSYWPRYKHLPAVALLLGGSSCAPSGDSGETGLLDNGASFSLMSEEIPQGVLLAAWSAGETALIVGGELGQSGLLLRYDGESLCVEEGVAEGALWWIHGPGEGEWYAVGEGGIILHDVGGVRTREDVDTDATLFGVYASGEEVWAVGGDVARGTGEIWRRQGGVWSLFAGDLPGLLFKTWEGWFVGDGHTWRLAGDALEEIDAGGERLVTVRGRDPEEDVWAVGGLSSPVILHFSGEVWEDFDTGPLSQPLNGLWTAPGEPLYVAGNGGLTAFHDGEGWVMPETPLTGEILHAVWPIGEEILWVGGNLLTSSGDYYGTLVRYGPDAPPPSITTCLGELR